MNIARRKASLVLIILVMVCGGAAIASAGTFVSVTVDVSPEQPTTDEEFEVDVRIASAEDSDRQYRINSVSLFDGNGEDAEEIADTSDDLDRLHPGSTESVTLDVERNETGVHELYATATLQRLGGGEREVTTPVTVRVHDPEPLVQVDTENAAPGTWRDVNVSVANSEDEPIRSVSLSLDADDVRFSDREQIASSIGPDEERTFTFSAHPGESEITELELHLSYEDSDEQYRELNRTVEADFTASDDVGEVQLTGVSAVTNGEGVEISGNAANVGTDDVDSVVVSVPDQDGVRGIQPQPEYFVGSVDGSDFASFTVNAEVEENVSEIPLEVTYRVDGVEHHTTTEIGYDADETDRDSSAGTASLANDSSTMLLNVVGTAAVALIALAIAYRRLR